jgi:putative endonuclease
VYPFDPKKKFAPFTIGNNLTKYFKKAFTAEYQVNRLVYYEHFTYVGNAIAREKQIKKWRKSKKLALIRGENPTMRDLAWDW